MTREHVKDKVAVWNGEKNQTASGLKRKDLMKTKDGRIVSKLQHKRGQELYKMMKKKGKLAEPFKSKSKGKSKGKSKSKSKGKKSKGKRSRGRR